MILVMNAWRAETDGFGLQTPGKMGKIVILFLLVQGLRYWKCGRYFTYSGRIFLGTYLLDLVSVSLSINVEVCSHI